MVKGVARSSGASSTTAAVPQQLPTMQTGQNVHDPLTQLNGHQGFGAMASLNPFPDLGVNPNDPNMMQSMLSSPQFMQQISALMNNPAIIDQAIDSNPQLAAMGPRVREVLQDEGIRQMMSNPETLQQMLRMASAFGGPSPFGASGYGGFGLPLGAQQSAFPAPGVPNTNPTNPANPTTATTPSTGSPPPNPFQFGASPAAAGGFNPALMQQMLAASHAMAQGAGAAGGWGGFGGGGAGYGMGSPPVPAPSDPRPPEERFQVQLQQLQDMGFINASQNVRALLATGGNVQGAVDYILSGSGL